MLWTPRVARFYCKIFYFALTLKYLLSTKRSYILKKTCSFELQICLSMYDILVDIRYLRVNYLTKIIRTEQRAQIVFQNAEGVTKNIVIKIFKNLQEIICARVSFLIKI